MEETEAVEEQAAATPIFAIYRRGYDPEQVDRYVLDQQRRLDEAAHRASESERKLAAAVGQLRELHRRVAVYESEARSAQPPQLDTLGERVQRILQEAWEGAYNLRQEAERDVTDMREQVQNEVDALREQAKGEVEELRQVASKEAADVVDEATRRALHIRDETERRRQAYLERVERDREQAISQITYLYDQRQCAIAELARLQASVQTTIEEMVRSPLGRPAPGVMDAAIDSAVARKGGTGGPTEAPKLPGMDLPGTHGAVGAPGESMERFVRPEDRETVRTSPRHSAIEEAEEIEQVMHSDEPPPGLADRVPSSQLSTVEVARPESAAPRGPVAGPMRSRAETPTVGMPAVTIAPAFGTEGDDRPEAAGANGGEGVDASELRSSSGPGTGGSVIPRPGRDAPLGGPVGPRGVIAGGPPSEPRPSSSGMAQSVQAGIEAAKGKLRRPRQQGVYDAEQDGWSS